MSIIAPLADAESLGKAPVPAEATPSSRAVKARLDRWRRLLLPCVRNIVEGVTEDAWTYDGNILNPQYPDGDNLLCLKGLRNSRSHIVDICRTLAERGTCDALILGPGQGTDIPWLKREIAEDLQRCHLPPELLSSLSIDVLALTDRLQQHVKPCVRTIWSGTAEQPTPFETFDGSAIKDQYDVVIDQFGVAEKSTRPHWTILKESGALRRGGVAYIDVMDVGGEAAHFADQSAESVMGMCQKFWRRCRPGHAFQISSESVGYDHCWFIVRRER